MFAKPVYNLKISIDNIVSEECIKYKDKLSGNLYLKENGRLKKEHKKGLKTLEGSINLNTHTFKNRGTQISAHIHFEGNGDISHIRMSRLGNVYLSEEWYDYKLRKYLR